MYFLLITILGVASLSLLPVKTLGTTEVQETPQALPLIAQTQPTTSAVKNEAADSVSRFTGGGEIWQEDDREVLIRNERGTKQNNNGGNGNNGGGGAAGKRGKNKKNKNLIDSMKESKELHAQTDIIPNHQKSQQNQLKSNQQQQQQQHEQHQQQQQQQQQHQLQKQNHPIHQTTHGKHINKQNLKSADENEPKTISPTCRYVKSAWTECDPKTNMRTRTLTLKKGDGCDLTKTIEKKCKKACRYEKGAWSECTGGQISRTDKLKSTSDSTCLATRVINKNCNTGKSKDKSNKERKNKDKGARKGRA